MEMLSRVVSPYQSNPLNINPLRHLLERTVDFEAVRSCVCVRLFVSATNVQTGRVKVFTGSELSAKSVMASACLPYIFQAVEFDDVPYWDGGFMGNPVLFPFFECCTTQDVLIVQVNPISRNGTPQSAR
jgi:NTE family protein